MIKSAYGKLTKTVRTKTGSISAGLAGLTMLLFLVSQPVFAATTVTVMGDTSAGENQPGWLFNRDATTATPYEFNYAQPDTGIGSLYVPPIGANPSDKFIAEDFLLTPISDVNSISYDFRIGDSRTASDAQQFYMSVYANFASSDPTKFYDCRYNVIPSFGSNGAFTTVTFDTSQSYSVTTRNTSPHTCPSVPDDMNTLEAGSTIRAFALNVGDTSVSDFGVEGYLDNVVVDTSAGVTAYDFEPQPLPACSADDTTFDTFTNGSVNGQKGWTSTGPYDQAIVNNIYGYSSFGCKSLRLSNAVTSGSFGDQTFSYSTANEAGEADSTSGGQSGGTRQTHYEAQFDIASTTPGAVQPDLSVSVSPDRGDGSRMSYLRFDDQAIAGIHVFFVDVANSGPVGNGSTFTEYEVATLDRSVPHTAKFVIDYVDGPGNDVVQIYIDGNLVKTGTTWEDYYRYDPEASAEQTPRTSDSLIFRAASDPAAPANAGKGFLFDNVNITTSTPDTTPPTTPVANPGTGAYTTPQFVALTSSDSDSGLANIYYTTDGSTPDNITGTLYTTPIPVSQSLILKAVAYDNAGNVSGVMTEFYAVDIPSGGGGGSGGSGGSDSSGGSGSGGGSNNGTGGTNTVTSPGGFGAGFGTFGAATGEVLGITTDNQNDQGNKDGKVKSESIDKSSNQDQKEDKAFLGLGWWWIPILIALAAIGYFVWRRFRQDEEA